MARTLFVVGVILLFNQAVIQARLLLPFGPCKGATPLKGEDGRDLFCGRGSPGPCPPGSYCDIHPTDRWAKCCPRTAPAIKPGKCPIPQFALYKRYHDLCSSDASCVGQQKCCWYSCGRRCTNPVAVQPFGSRCPKPTGPGLCAELCGSGCKGGQICCSNGCGHQCMNPVLVAPVGQCPKPTGPGLCAELCRSGCKGGQICCSNGCGHQCMNPVLLRG